MKITSKKIILANRAAGNPESALIQALLSSVYSNTLTPYSDSQMATIRAAVNPGVVALSSVASNSGQIFVYRKNAQGLLIPQAIKINSVTYAIRYQSLPWAQPQFQLESTAGGVLLAQEIRTPVAIIKNPSIKVGTGSASLIGNGMLLSGQILPFEYTTFPLSNVINFVPPNIADIFFYGGLTIAPNSARVELEIIIDADLPYNQSNLGITGIVLAETIPDAIGVSFSYAGTPSTASVYTEAYCLGSSVIVFPLKPSNLNEIATQSAPFALIQNMNGGGTPPPVASGFITSSLSIGN